MSVARDKRGYISMQIMLLFAGISVLCVAIVSLTARTARFNAINTRYAGLYNLAVSCVNAQLGQDNADLESLYADMTTDDEPPDDEDFKNAALTWLTAQTGNFTITHESFNIDISADYKYIIGGIELTLTVAGDTGASVALSAKTEWDNHRLKLRSIIRKSG
jgi:hypothetical protein